jgi:hypothetical protein
MIETDPWQGYGRESMTRNEPLQAVAVMVFKLEPTSGRKRENADSAVNPRLLQVV